MIRELFQDNTIPTKTKPCLMITHPIECDKIECMIRCSCEYYKNIDNWVL